MVMGEVGPSILLCSMSETVAFAIGAMSSMPAVRTFALFAAGAVFVDFLLQITVFASLLALDARRSEGLRCDCLPCVEFDIPEQPHSPSYIQSFMKKFANFILRPIPAIILFLLSVLMFAFAIVGMLNVPIGLNQQLAFPSGSYINDYFDAINSYLEVGAPVYFVVSGDTFETVAAQNLVCGGQPGCSQNSIVSQAFLASENPNHTHIALPVSSWIDDYIDWIQPTSGCCTIFSEKYLDYEPGYFCPSILGDAVRDAYCEPCPVSFTSRPTNETFDSYLNFFLQDVPNIKCAKAGHAAYGSAVKTTESANVHIADPVKVETSYFMTYHTKCVTSDDFIGALKQARELCDKVSAETGVDVFPYSIFYVFYEQYLTIVDDSILGLGVSLAAILLITSLLLGSLWAGLIIFVTICMIIIDILGVMYLWSIDLNAISLVNLIMAVGISVEFVAHITRAFCLAPGTRRARAKAALSKMGSNVVSGIMCTKIAGIVVLAFSVCQIFEVCICVCWYFANLIVDRCFTSACIF
jgi:Niemann-Pick C1 protein